MTQNYKFCFLYFCFSPTCWVWLGTSSSSPSHFWIPILKRPCIISSEISLSQKSLLLLCVSLDFWRQLSPGTRLFLTIVQPNYFSLFSWGVTEFYILTAIVICCHLQALALYNHHEQEALEPACALCMAGRVSCPLCISSSWISVLAMSLITLHVTISPFYNCLVQIHGFWM